MTRPRSKTPERGARLRQARMAAGFETGSEAARHHGWKLFTFAANENGNAPFSFKTARIYAEAFGVDALWLYDGIGTSDSDAPPAPVQQTSQPLQEVFVPVRSQPLQEVFVPVIGRVGADPEGAVLFATGQAAGDLAPVPPGGTERAVALLVAGHSMHGLVDDGGLIYFEDQRTPPTPDMLGHVVVVETDTDEVLVKRLLRGSRSGRYDLESLVGPLRRDCRLRWAAHITAIIPPFQARRILRSGVA